MASEKIIAQKVELVNEVTAKMNAATSTVIVDYRGLTVGEVTQLRRELREAGVEMHVFKNNLLRRAADEVNCSELKEHLAGPNAALFATTDATAAARVAHNFAQTHAALELKAGIMEGAYVDQASLKELALLPNREGMYSMLLSVLQAPIRNIAVVAKAIGEQKEQ
ncbi:50S ribosomal protein L10 [Erysipelotrichaceae bacterium]|nr:50S ribosomal protein L10 [Erysipelotrichaceae bacterium]